MERTSGSVETQGLNKVDDLRKRTMQDGRNESRDQVGRSGGW